MKKPFFSCDQSVLRLRHVVASWGDTKFAAHSKVKGAGVDCVHFCAEVYRELGLFDEYQFPDYTIDGGNHLLHSAVLAWVRSSGNFEQVLGGDMKPGDLLCFQIGKVEHHVGVLVYGHTFAHCALRIGVALASVQDLRYKSRLTSVWRPMK